MNHPVASDGQPEEAPQRSRPLTRLLRFGGLQAANAIAPIAVLPVVTSLIGPSGWVGLANGLGIGAAAAVAVGMAWAITGPPRVAAVTKEESKVVFSEALVMRLIVLFPVLALAVLITWWLAPSDPVLAAAMAVATALNGLAANWYFVGRASAGGIMWFETVPKMAATALSIPAVWLTGQAMAYPILLGIAAIGGTLASTRAIMGGSSVFQHWRLGAKALPKQIPLSLAGLLSTGTTSLTVPIATTSGISTLGAAQFAAAIRLRTMTQAGIGAGTTALQGWVSEEGAQVWRRRSLRALQFNTALGLMAGVAIAILAPLFDTFIFGEGVEVSWLTAIALGVTCVFYAMSASLTNHILSPAGRSDIVVRSTFAASLIAVPLVFLGARHFGSEGAMGAVAACEGLVVVLQGLAARRALRSR